MKTLNEKPIERKVFKTFHKFLWATAFLTLGFLISSCNPADALKPNNRCNEAWTKQVQKEINDYSAALTAYGNDPSTANCNEVKKTGNKYIDALKDVEKCVYGTSRADWDKAIEDSREQLNDLDCQKG